MKKIRRLICIMLALAMLLTALAGCGNGETNPSVDTPSASPSTSPSAQQPQNGAEPETAYFPLDEPVTLSYFDSSNTQILTYYESKNDLPWWQELEARTNIHMDWITSPSDQTTTQLMLMISGGSMTDLLNIYTYYTGGIAGAIQDEVIIDLAPYLDDYLEDYNRVINSNDVYYRSAVIDGSGTVGQVCKFYSDDIGPDRGMVMRGDWLDDIGVNNRDVQTYDDWYDVLTAFKTEKGASSPVWISYYGSPMHSALAAGFDLVVDCFFFSDPFTNMDGTAVFSPLHENYLPYMEMMQQWYDEGLIYQDYINGAIMFNDTGALANSEVGAFLTYASSMNNYDEIMADDPDYRLVGVSYPVKTRGQTKHITGPQELYQSEGLCISSDCEKIEEACRWLNYFFTEEGNIFLNYGTEGVSYNVVDGEYVITELVINSPTGIGWWEYTCGSKAGFGVEEFSRGFSAYDEYQIETLELWADNSPGDYNWPDNAKMTVDESDEYSAIWADIFTLTGEFVNSFIMGRYGQAEYEAYCQQVKDLNIGRCIEIKQAALDRYLGG